MTLNDLYLRVRRSIPTIQVADLAGVVSDFVRDYQRDFKIFDTLSFTGILDSEILCIENTPNYKKALFIYKVVLNGIEIPMTLTAEQIILDEYDANTVCRLNLRSDGIYIEFPVELVATDVVEVACKIGLSNDIPVLTTTVIPFGDEFSSAITSYCIYNLCSYPDYSNQSLFNMHYRLFNNELTSLRSTLLKPARLGGMDGSY